MSKNVKKAFIFWRYHQELCTIWSRSPEIIFDPGAQKYISPPLLYNALKPGLTYGQTRCRFFGTNRDRGRVRCEGARERTPYLTRVVAGLTAGAKTAGRQYEYLLRDRVDLAYALGVTDHRYFGLADAQRYGTGLAHVPVTGDGASFAGRVVDAARGQAHQAHAVLELGLTVQLEQRDIVVQRLRVVVVVDVRGGHAQRLRARAAVLTGQVVVANAHVDRVAGPHDAATRTRD